MVYKSCNTSAQKLKSPVLYQPRMWALFGAAGVHLPGVRSARTVKNLCYPTPCVCSGIVGKSEGGLKKPNSDSAPAWHNAGNLLDTPRPFLPFSVAPNIVIKAY